MAFRAALNLKSFKTKNGSSSLSRCFCPSYLYHVDEDVNGGIDGEHQVVALGQDLGPGRPEQQLAIGDHLVCLVSIGNQLLNRKSFSLV